MDDSLKAEETLQIRKAQSKDGKYNFSESDFCLKSLKNSHPDTIL